MVTMRNAVFLGYKYPVRTSPTDRRPLVDEIWCQRLWIEGCRVVSAAGPLRDSSLSD
jgi:hypothetical protein